MVFRRLARPTGEPGVFEPDLSASWELLSDGRSVLITLREDLKWADGREISVSDVAFLLRRPKDLFPEESLLESIEVRDESSVIVRYRSPLPEIVEAALGAHIYPIHLLESASAEVLQQHEFNLKPVGSGPFRLDTWESDQFLSFLPDPQDARPDDGPYLDRLVFQVFSDKQAAVLALENGDLDLLFKVPPDVASRLKTDDRFVVHDVPTRGFFCLVWNANKYPFDLPEVRSALTATIDRRVLARHFAGSVDHVAQGPVPPGHAWHSAAVESPGFDLTAAANQLTAAELTRVNDSAWQLPDGRPLQASILILAGRQTHGEIAAIVADNLRGGGVDAEVREVELANLLQRVDEGDFDVALLAWGQSNPVDLEGWFGKAGWEWNHSGIFSDVKLEELFDVMTTATSGARLLVFRRLHPLDGIDRPRDHPQQHGGRPGRCGLRQRDVVSDRQRGLHGNQRQPDGRRALRGRRGRPPQPGSPAVDHGPKPSSYTGVPCTDGDGNPSLRGHDGDGLAQLDIGVYELANTARLPAEVPNVRWTSKTSLEWDAETTSLEYHVCQGTLANLGYADFGACYDVGDPDRTDLLLLETTDPAPGEGYFYVITSDDLAGAGGEESTLGMGRRAERSNFAVCP